MYITNSEAKPFVDFSSYNTDPCSILVPASGLSEKVIPTTLNFENPLVVDVPQKKEDECHHPPSSSRSILFSYHESFEGYPLTTGPLVTVSKRCIVQDRCRPTKRSRSDETAQSSSTTTKSNIMAVIQSQTTTQTPSSPMEYPIRTTSSTVPIHHQQQDCEGRSSGLPLVTPRHLSSQSSSSSMKNSRKRLRTYVSFSTHLDEIYSDPHSPLLDGESEHIWYQRPELKKMRISAAQDILGKKQQKDSNNNNINSNQDRLVAYKQRVDRYKKKKLAIKCIMKASREWKLNPDDLAKIAQRLSKDAVEAAFMAATNGEPENEMPLINL